ncbi:lipoprotein [Mycoplasma feriruminatoris]|uniref:Lipoprotein n=1 Tax=Mycoplasma feriruminatoris TaxID=1179777 RepID=A0AAX3TGQ3_9MOLU|nr:lipoprotein [Mycoplasma feriruminatoris]WFQ93093.1 hypothetical protein MFERI14822_00886 [Mycoplasma feriruminatoris]WFQ93929.1 lipoprotein [Mycoplasma feriruminatoris]WFQ96391.1 lipoprotein [Mycoplasma feriruminatoris]
MKKLLTVFGSIALLATTSAIVVSCEKIQQKDNNKTGFTMTEAPKMDKEKEKKMTMASSPKAINAVTSITNNNLLIKTESNDPLIFSELYGVNDFSKERAKQRHLEETSELVLENSLGVESRIRKGIPDNVDYKNLSETQDLILKNSDSIGNMELTKN